MIEAARVWPIWLRAWWGAVALGAGLVLAIGALVPQRLALVSDVYGLSVGAVGGLVIIGRARQPEGWLVFHLLVGLGILISSAGVLFRILDPPLTGPWQLIVLAPGLVACLLVLAAITVRLAGIDRLAAIRSALEAILIALAIGIAVWRIIAERIAPQDTAFVGLVTVDAFILGVAVVAAIQNRERGLTVAAISAAMLVTSALSLSVLPEQQAVLPATLLWLVGWPGVIVGVLGISPTAVSYPDAERARVEPRHLVGFTTVVLLAVGIGVGSLDHDNLNVQILGLVVVVLYLRELVRAAEARIVYRRLSVQALQDPLTGLDNRWALDGRLRELAAKGRHRVGFVTVDLDRFKEINDTFGHPVGDELLRQVGRRLTALADTYGARAFRVGGDEFVVVVRGRRAERLAAAVQGAVDAAAAALPELRGWAIGVSVGVRISDLDPAADLNDIAAESSQAMRVAKTHPQRTVVLFDDELARAQGRRSRIERRLREIVVASAAPRAACEIEVHVQPIVHAADGRVAGGECLARWHDPTLGQVSPQEFIEVAEQSGLINDLGVVLMRQALRSAVDSGLVRRGLGVSVNVSPMQLRDPVFAARVQDLLQTYGVRPEAFTVEVTESVLLRVGDPAISTLEALSRYGVRIALDDFGTGYSSLDYLTRVPVQCIKIDRSITSRLDDPKVWAIVATAAELARRLSLDMVMEGVQTPGDLRHADELGIDLLQGWHFCAAVPAATFGEHLATQSI